MLYTYDENKLSFCKLNIFKILTIVFTLVSAISVGSLLVGHNIGKSKSIIEYSEMERLLLIKEADTFSQDKLVHMLKDLNVKYPHIVLAQSIVETGKWKSKIFLENQNLFGMKQAKMRITTAEGTQYNHAFYNHWRESVYDYAFYQCRYLHSIKTESNYFQYLGANYAEDPNYVNKIKSLIEKEGLKDLFN